MTPSGGDPGAAAAARIALPVARTDSRGVRRIDVRALLGIAAPLMLTNSLQAALNLTDTWFIGRLSTESVAAIGAIYWLMSAAIFALGGVGLVVQTFVSQADGGGRRVRAAQSAWGGVWAAVITLPLYFAASLVGAPLLGLFGLPSGVEASAIEYWEPRMQGAVLGTITWAFLSFFNGIGATRLTLMVAVVTVVANIPANHYFMFVADLGMAGAAWGTNLAQACGVLVAGAAFLTGPLARRYRTWSAWRPRPRLMARQLRMGFPIGVMYGADVLGVALMQLMVTQVGNAGAAATQIVMMLTSIAYMPTLGLASAGTTVVGQAIGAGDRGWAARLGDFVIRCCAGMMLGVALLLLLLGPWVLPLFVGSGDSESVEAVRWALLFLWPAAAYQFFDGLYFGSSFSLRAAGDTSVPAMASLGLSWLVFVPLAHTLVFDAGSAWVSGLPQAGLGALGGWLALMSYAMVLGGVMFWRWRSGQWRKIDLWRT
jgi:MATE family multidrug resistance protein